MCIDASSKKLQRMRHGLQFDSAQAANFAGFVLPSLPSVCHTGRVYDVFRREAEKLRLLDETGKSQHGLDF